MPDHHTYSLWACWTSKTIGINMELDHSIVPQLPQLPVHKFLECVWGNLCSFSHKNNRVVGWLDLAWRLRSNLSKMCLMVFRSGQWLFSKPNSMKHFCMGHLQAKSNLPKSVPNLSNALVAEWKQIWHQCSNACWKAFPEKWRQLEKQIGNQFCFHAHSFGMRGSTSKCPYTESCSHTIAMWFEGICHMERISVDSYPCPWSRVWAGCWQCR